MKLLLRLTVLGLAGFGANELYRKLAPRLSGAGNRASVAVDPNAPTAPSNPVAAPAGRVGDSTTSRPLSEMAAHELGLDDEPAKSDSESGTSTASDARG